MKVDIKEQKKNPLMKREESMLTIDHSGTATPSRLDILEAASKALKIDKSLMIVDSIFTEAGKSVSNVRVLVYSKKEEIPEFKLQKMQPKKKGKKAEGAEDTPDEQPAEEKKPEEEPKEEKPAEKPKEEAKPEEKPAEKPKEDKPEEKN
ncbi:MAG: hypothetical protein ABIH52_00685 [Candidatus Aenigmatarchaeota archaeon]|nr:hypothetical protein [Nanoarchaeota archaeon]